MKRSTSSFLSIVLLLSSLLITTALPAENGSNTSDKSGYNDLVQLLDEFLEFRDPENNQPRQIIRDTAGQAIEPEIGRAHV